MVKFPQRFDVFLVALDPALGFEIRKTRPCVIVSPNEINQYLRTVIIVPMTTRCRNYPTRITLHFEGKDGQIALDQIRTVDKERLTKHIGALDIKIAGEISECLTSMFSL